MGIPFERLTPPRWGGDVPGFVERGPLVLHPECVIDPPVILSPMAAVTNPPFRKICCEMGAGLVVTEMVAARGLIHRAPKTMQLVDLQPDEAPVAVQIFGKDPQEMGQAARVAEELGAHSVDVNMGCPMRKVVSSGHGAALLRDPGRVREIFHAMSEAVKIPVTGKTRAGWEDADAIEVAQAMQVGGAAAITIHGRTRCDFYDGHVDLAVIAEVKRSVDMPVIGNGDVCDWQSARRMFHVTGCDAVMVARGALGNPWVFRELAADLAGRPVPPRPSQDERRETIARHVDRYIESFDEELMCRQIRKHLLWYFRDTPGEKVLRRRLSDLECRHDVMAAVDDALRANRDLSDVALQHPRAR
jgi:tRNA-dihydrouridine synthase B